MSIFEEIKEGLIEAIQTENSTKKGKHQMAVKEMNLHQRILKIADMAGVLQKSKSGYSYKYVPEEDIQAKVTAGLQKYGIMLYNSIVPGTLNVRPITYEKYDPKIKQNKPVNEVIVSADMTYTWVNVDNPEERIETTWAFVGQMEDASQAMGAGLTYANRYYLMKQLQLATTESDPDNYRSKQKEAENYEEEEAAKKAEEIRLASIKAVTETGSALIESGVSKDAVAAVVAKHNNGDKNPSTIPNPDISEAILAELNTLNSKRKKD